jgi:hypothetical protein
MRNFTVIPNEILEESQLSVPARYLLCVLLKYCGQNDWCYPSQETLGKQLGYTARYIRDLLNELESNRLIVRKRLGFNKTNTYKATKSFLKTRNQNESHLGSMIPLNEGIVVPPNSTYIKAKDKRGMESMRDILVRKEILKPSKVILKSKFSGETN